MKNSFWISVVYVVMIVLIVGSAVYYFVSRRDEMQVATSANQVEVSQPKLPPQFLSTMPNTNELKAGGSSYRQPQNLYTFLYPSDYTVDTQNNGQISRIYKKGATQRGQTEMYDGVILVFETIDLSGKTLEQFVDEDIKNITADGTSQLIQPKKMVMLGSYPAFTFESQGLGSQMVLILAQNEQSKQAVKVSFLVADPEQKGYQAEVDQILSTFEFQK